MAQNLNCEYVIAKRIRYNYEAKGAYMDLKSSIIEIMKPIMKSSSLQNSSSEKKAVTEVPSTAIGESNSAVLDDSNFLEV